MKLSSLLANRMFKDSFWTIFGTALGKGLTVLGGIIVANLLGKEVFGQYGLLRNTLLLIAIFSTMGLGYTSTIFVSRYVANNERYLHSLISGVIKITFCFSSVIAIFVFLFAAEIASFLEDETLSIPIQYTAIIIVFNAITTTQVAILAGFKMFKETAYVNVVYGVCSFILSILLTYYNGFEGALMALLISQILNCVLNYYVLRRRMLSLQTRDKAPFASIVYQSIPVAFQEMSASVVHWIGSVMLLKLASYGELGLYSAATQWTTILLFIPVVLRNVTLSHLSSSGTSKERNKILKSMTMVYVAATLVPATIIVLFSDFITSFYGESFFELGKVLCVASYSTVTTSVYNVYSSEFLAMNKNWLLYGITMFRDLLMLCFMYALITYLNLDGAFSMGLATLLAGAMAVLIVVLLHRKFKEV